MEWIYSESATALNKYKWNKCLEYIYIIQRVPKKCTHTSTGDNILNSCPTQGRVEGWDAMKPLYYRSVSSKGAGRPRLSHHHKGGWNETKWMRWVWRNGGMKFVVGENGRNPIKNLPRPRFIHHETHMEGPRRELGTPAVGGERLTACATRPPLWQEISNIFQSWTKKTTVMCSSMMFCKQMRFTC